VDLTDVAVVAARIDVLGSDGGVHGRGSPDGANEAGLRDAAPLLADAAMDDADDVDGAGEEGEWAAVVQGSDVCVT
jgi:hypothetical protein